jgi:catechol 2,3-dioxygenase-like lactoylglutathione lyase family enzyme
MIGYATLGSNDIPRAAKFYDAVFGVIGAKRFMESEKSVVWAVAPDKPALGVITPYDGKPATPGNGTMISLVVDSPDKVNGLHAKALELGGRDEGAPGPRGDHGFYAAYFRDLDGNKLCAYCMVKKA